MGRHLEDDPFDRVSDPAPARRLAAQLAMHRRAGTTFGEAWAVALEDAVRELSGEDARQWRKAFRWTREAWHASYEGEPCPRHLALTAFVPSDDRERNSVRGQRFVV
jgi:hypothetical protein